jgi:hypothetical protein
LPVSIEQAEVQSDQVFGIVVSRKKDMGVPGKSALLLLDDKNGVGAFFRKGDMIEVMIVLLP